MTIRSSAALLVLLTGSGCVTSSANDEQRRPSEEDGPIASVSAAVATVPSGVQCLQVTVGPATINQGAPFPDPARLEMGVKMTGWQMVTATAWDVACSTSPLPEPSWVAETQWVEIKAGVNTSVSIRLFPNIAPTATVDFVNPPIALAAYDSATVSLHADGAIKVWGWTTGTPTYGTALPTQVAKIPGATAISGGGGLVCYAVGTTVKCVGSNDYGQLGNGIIGGLATWSSPATVSLPGVTWTTLLAKRTGACAINSLSTAYCWGKNDVGQVKLDSAPTSQPTPVAWYGGGYVSAFAASSNLTCATSNEGQVVCLGQVNTALSSGVREPLAGAGVVFGKNAISGSGLCGLGVEGSTWCYGSNDSGQLGNGTTSTGNSLARVTTVNNAKELVAAIDTYCAITAADEVVCWGKNDVGQLGIGTKVPYNATPTKVVGLSNVARLTAGNFHFCAQKNDGAVWCWGANNFGQLGDGTKQNRFVPVQTQL